jgi:hypothetical protein
VTKHLIAIVLSGLAAGATAVAQEQPPAKAVEKPPVSTPLKVQVTISRFQGERKLSSIPYTLSVNTNNTRQEASRLRMGGKVPIIAVAAHVVDGKQMAAGPVNYQDVGTNIDCYASITDDGRFKVVVIVEDTSVYPEDQAISTVRGHPAFRTLALTNAAIMRDGQSTQFTSATDKVSGETVKIDVMLNVVK